MLKVLKFFFTSVFIMIIFNAARVVAWVIPVIPHQLGTGMLGFFIVSLIMIFLGMHEFKGLNLKDMLFKRKVLLELFLSSLYLVLLCTLGINLKQDLAIDDNFTWDDGELHELESFDTVGKTYLRETETGYELLLKKGESHRELNEFKFEEITINERIDAEPTIKIYSGCSNSWLERAFNASSAGNRERCLSTKVKVEIFLPIMKESYFVIKESADK